MKRITQAIKAFFGSSLFWGPLAALGFYTLIHQGVLSGPFFDRYFTNHWVLGTEVVLFFVGVAELLLKFFDVSEQRARLARKIWDAPLQNALPTTEAPKLIAQLNQLSDRERQSPLVRRLFDALSSIVRKESADHLDEELKYLSDADAQRVHASYALMRIVIWAIPILGFLGTVIGITDAIGQLNPQALEKSLDGVTFGLGIAFDTTALALTLSMFLMFSQFLVDRLETNLMADLDLRVADELSGRFMLAGTSSDPQVAAVRQMGEQVISSTEKLVQRQADIWQRTMESAQKRWNEAASQAQEHVESQLVKSLSRSVQSHAETLAKSEAEASERNRRHWNRVLKRLAEQTQTMQSQHVEIVKQSEILRQVVEATGQITRLEESLNQNLAALAGAQHFHDTLSNLSAMVSLLNARLGQVVPAGRTVDLHSHNLSKAA